MNQGFYNFPTGPQTPVATFTAPPFLIDRMNTSEQQATGNSSSNTGAKLYYGTFGFTRSGSNSTCRSNLLYLTAHWLGRPCIVREMVVGVVLPTTASNMYFGIFASDSAGLPSTCLYSSPVVATATNYNYSGPSPFLEIKTPGWYWFGVVFETNNAGPMQTVAGNPIGMQPSSGFVANYNGQGLRCSHTYGPMPSSLSTYNFTLEESSSNHPAIDLHLSSNNSLDRAYYRSPVA